MDVRFQPHVTERRFKKLAYGTPGKPGLVGTWVGLDITDSYEDQLRLALHARRLLGLEVLVQVLHTTFGPVFTGTILKKELEFICWRVAANIDRLATDRPISPWSGLRGTVVAPVQIVYTRYGWSSGREKKPGSTLTFRIIDGELCPVQFHRWYPDRFLYVLANDIGIGGWRMARPFEGHRGQLYGMRFVATLAPSQVDKGSITIERHNVGQFKDRNRTLMRRRAKPCPLEYDWPCHKCSLGEDSCPDREPASRACRPVSLRDINCSVCGERTWHDEGNCTRCHRRAPVSV